MEIQFQEKEYACKRIGSVEVFYQEETAELILPDSSADVQAILRSGAVACIRDREVRAGCYAVSGAFQAAVLYSTECGDEPILLESWMPFRASVSMDSISGDDFGAVEIRIRSVDARILNSRKILLRVNYAVRMTVYQQDALRTRIADSDDMLQLRCETVRGTFPVACAEREGKLSENIDLPAFGAEVDKILRAVPEIRIAEQSIVDGKAVVKGSLTVHLLYRLENGQLGCHDAQFPLSQFTQLDGECEDASLRSHAFLTDFSLEQDDFGWLVNAAFIMQSVAWKCMEIPVITDGYCVGREFNAEYAPIFLHEPLDAPESEKILSGSVAGDLNKLVDSETWLDFPTCKRNDGSISVCTVATVGVLYYDDSGNLRGETIKCEGEYEFALAGDAICYADADMNPASFTAVSVRGGEITCPVNFSARCFAETEVGAMQKAEIGEVCAASHDRASLLVRRWDGGDLWDLAKACNTTVRSICSANDLRGEPQEHPSLLIIPLA